MKDRPEKEKNIVEMVWPNGENKRNYRIDESKDLKNGQWRFLRPDLLVRVFVILVAVKRYIEEGIDITDGMPTFRMKRNQRYVFIPCFLKSERLDGMMTFCCTLSTLRVTMYCSRSLDCASCHLQFDNELREPVVMTEHQAFGRMEAYRKIKMKLEDIHNSRPITEAPPTSGNTQGGPTSPVAAAEDGMTDGESAEPTGENRNVTNDVPLPNSDDPDVHNVEPTEINHSAREEYPFATRDDSIDYMMAEEFYPADGSVCCDDADLEEEVAFDDDPGLRCLEELSPRLCSVSAATTRTLR
jgi:hypothetical protein